MTGATNYPLRLGQAVGALSMQTGIEMGKLVDWLCSSGIEEAALHYFGSAPQLKRLRATLGISPTADLSMINHVVRRLKEEFDDPVNVVLHCPACKAQHIDGYESSGWTNPPHKTHLCHFAGQKWTAADRQTFGVRAIIPGSSATWPIADAKLFSAALLPPRDETGRTYHPDIPEIGEEESPAAWLWQIGYECRGVLFEDDASQEIQDAYQDGGAGIGCAWTPTAPEGEGWRLAAIYDTEDGPYAMFVRPFPQLVQVTG